MEPPFERASLGQQASALLELLLSQFAGTLIIGHPEDDIDNWIIMKVVNLIRSSKHRRQLIFATHNANVVVNGDADKVIALLSAEVPSGPSDVDRKIDISSDGAIETADVRKDITKIMEGSRDAFHLRSRK
jgi:chromosome segregation protein